MPNKPCKLDNPEEVQAKIDEYFEVMDKCNRPYTMSGLAYFLGTNRMTIMNSRNRNPEINEIIGRARDKIEQYVEEQLFVNPRTVGCIFNLKNNFGWQDKQEISVGQTNQNLLADMSTEDIKKLLQEETEYIEVENEEKIIN